MIKTTRKFFWLMLASLFLITKSFSQKKRDITTIEDLIKAGLVDSAFTVLKPYCLKFPEEKTQQFTSNNILQESTRRLSFFSKKQI
ncbi:MAG: hypothetical protein IPK10_17505 [Bacteroidetes bacterium]|nr:hypothetical protein [Bacteroidota bacterium]